MKKGKGRGAKILTTSDKKRTENIMANTNKNQQINRTDSLPMKMIEHHTPAVNDFVIDSEKKEDKTPATQSTTTQVTITSEIQNKISNNESKEKTPCESKSNEPEVSKLTKEEAKIDTHSNEQSTPVINHQNNNQQSIPQDKKGEEDTVTNRDNSGTSKDTVSERLENTNLNTVPHLETKDVDNTVAIIDESKTIEVVTSRIFII